MQTSWRIVFLIAAAAAVAHLTTWTMLVILFGYLGFERLDNWLVRRERQKEREKVIEDEMWGWEPSPDDSNCEDKGEMSRVRLTGSDQIIVSRVAELLRRIP
jgi:hypothetical protein